ncbi:MAG: 23S rRNA (guanosine(2251)-2'-O)-methyltransferase RlmB [Alphaproteobacteria bacterium]|nr:23S rRNA (guanosine(2251)-2'-O)-methyltransferase RlmB [Alphaproteobacteria bacterium]
MDNAKTRSNKARKSFSRNKAARAEARAAGSSSGKPATKSAGKFVPRHNAGGDKRGNGQDNGHGFGKTRPSWGGTKKPTRLKDHPRQTNRPAHNNRQPDISHVAPQTPQARDGVLIWGLHAARAAWMNPKRKVNRAWLTDAGQKLFEATQAEARDDLLKRPDAKRQERADLDRLTPPGSVHQGILIEVAPLPEPSLNDIIDADPPPDLILVLDQVTDPHNVGAILRSAAAFGAGAVIMTERNAPATTGVLAKTASGALEHVPMLHVVNLARALEDLRKAGYWCVGLAEEGAKDLGELDLSGRTALVLGAEGEGLRHLTRQKCDELARLPTGLQAGGGAIGSLNVSNAAAVALYEVRRQAKKR